MKVQLLNYEDSNAGKGTSRPKWRPDNAGRYGPNIPIYLDALISPDFFKNQFLNTFGKVAFFFTLAGSWFAGFMLLQYMYKVIIAVLRGLNIHTMVGDSVSIVRIGTDAVFNTLLVATKQDQLLKGKDQINQAEKREQEMKLKARLYPFLDRAETVSTLSGSSEKEHKEQF